jgi:hypothetical protein
MRLLNASCDSAADNAVRRSVSRPVGPFGAFYLFKCTRACVDVLSAYALGRDYSA